MAFDIGTLLDQAENIASTYRSSNFDDSMTLADAETYGDQVSSGLAIGLTAASKTVTQVAASVANVGKIMVISGATAPADNGAKLIVGAVTNTSYDLAESDMTDFSATNTEAATAAIYDYPHLESDLNFLRSLEKEKNGTANWFDECPTYNNPDDTTSTVKATLDHLKDKHTKAQLMRRFTFADNATAGYTIATNDTDLVVTDSTPYTDATRLSGLPTEDGAGTPDATNYNLLFVRLYVHGTEEPLQKVDGTPIWGRLIDGQNAAGGTGELTDVGVKFYTGDNDVTAAAYTVEAALNGVKVDVVYYAIDSMYDFTRNQMPVNLGGAFILNGADAELVDDVRDLQEFVGSADNETSPTITNSTNYYPFSAGAVHGVANPADTDLEEMANALNDMIGDLDFTAAQEGIIGGDGSTLDISDMFANIADAILNVAGMEPINYKHTGATIEPGTPITIPGAYTYTANAGTVLAGRYMWVYHNGQLQQAHRTDYNNDYEETSNVTITFLTKKVQANDRLTFIILK